MEVRFEAWTRPETGSFTRLFPIRDVSHWQIQMGMFGHGTITIPADRVDDILYVDPQDHSNDVATMIRAYIGTDHLYDFYAARASILVDETGIRQATVTGGGPGTALERVAVRQYDYDVNPSVIPDWIYGPANTVLTNADFEGGLPDEDFEDQAGGGWSESSGEGPDKVEWEPLDAAPDVNGAYPQGGVYSLEIPFGDAPSGAQRTINVVPGGRIQISYGFKEPTGNGDRYLIWADASTVHSANGWIYNGYAFAELDAAARFAGTADGTWQTLDLDVTVGDEQSTLTFGVQCTGSGNMPTGYIDDGVFTGDGLGTDPWHPHGLEPYMDNANVFALSTTWANTGTYSLAFQTTTGRGVGDHGQGPTQFITCTPGVQYDSSVVVYHAGGVDHDFILAFKRRYAGWDADSGVITVPTATPTTLTCNGVATQEAMEFTVRWENGTAGPTQSPIWYIDDAVLGEGLAKSTMGEIWGDLITDAATGHTPDRTALAWLTTTFTDTQDSTSTNWDQDRALTVARGQNMRRVFEFHTGTFGYEGEIRPDPADDTDIQFHLYNPGAMGTDYSATDGTAILRQGVVSVGPILRSEPAATYAMVEGDQQWFGEDRDTALETVWGEIERYRGSEEMQAGSLNDLAAELTTGEETETLAVKFQNPPLTPGVDYRIGDTLQVILGVVPSAAYRVAAVAVAKGDPEPVFQVQFIPV